MSLSYLGIAPLTPPEFVIRSYPPTVDDYHNFNIGCMWLDDGSHSPIPLSDLWILVRLYGARAKWITMAKLVFNTLTGNTGAAVPQNADDGTLILAINGLTVSGDPITHTLTITTANDQRILQSLTSGLTVYADALYNIDLIGTPGLLNTSGNPGAHTISIIPAGSIATNFVTNLNNAVPATNILNIMGNLPIETQGLFNTVSIKLSNGTDGQLLIGGGAQAAWNSVTTMTGMTKTIGPNTLNLEVTSTRSFIGFRAIPNGGAPIQNITGDGTIYHCVPHSTRGIYRSGYNVGNGYKTYGINEGMFVAPFDGYYYFNAFVLFDADYGRTGGLECYVTIVAGGRTYLGNNFPTHAKINQFGGDAGTISYYIRILVYLLTGDTAYFNITSEGGAKTDDIRTQEFGFDPNGMVFDGYLINLV
jgi:hypothetical protein